MCSVFTAPVNLVSRPDKDCDSSFFFFISIFILFYFFYINKASGWIFPFLMPTADSNSFPYLHYFTWSHVTTPTRHNKQIRNYTHFKVYNLLSLDHINLLVAFYVLHHLKTGQS